MKLGKPTNKYTIHRTVGGQVRKIEVQEYTLLGITTKEETQKQTYLTEWLKVLTKDLNTVQLKDVQTNEMFTMPTEEFYKITNRSTMGSHG